MVCMERKHDPHFADRLRVQTARSQNAWSRTPMGVAKRVISAVAMVAVFCAIVSCGGSSSNNSGQSQNAQQILSIAPVPQELPEWCWLASGQMVFQFFQIPAVNPLNYQCGIIGAFYGPASLCYANCQLCDAGAGSSSNVTLMLQYYTYDATGGGEILNSRFTPSALPFQQTKSDIDAKTPVLAGINSSAETVLFAQSQHLVVIVGYEIQNGSDFLVVNDPFPFAAAGYPDPYLNAGAQALQPGQYLVSYQTFVQGLLWNTSFDGLALGSPQSSERKRLEHHFGMTWEHRLERQGIR
jgi:hypothetical protein